MNTVLYCSANGTIHETTAFTKADIDQLVLDQGLECLTSADRQFDFWFSPATPGCQKRVNRGATELLLATTRFAGKNVPMLHGAVVIATHDADGDLDGLSWEQLDLLAGRHRALTKRDERALDRRIARTAAPKQRAPKKSKTTRVAAEPTGVSCAHPRSRVRH